VLFLLPDRRELQPSGMGEPPAEMSYMDLLPERRARVPRRHRWAWLATDLRPVPGIQVITPHGWVPPLWRHPTARVRRWTAARRAIASVTGSSLSAANRRPTATRLPPSISIRLKTLHTNGR